MSVMVNTGFNENVEFDNGDWRLHANGNLEIFDDEKVVALFRAEGWFFVQKINQTPAVEAKP